MKCFYCGKTEGLVEKKNAHDTIYHQCEPLCFAPTEKRPCHCGGYAPFYKSICPFHSSEQRDCPKCEKQLSFDGSCYTCGFDPFSTMHAICIICRHEEKCVCDAKDRPCYHDKLNACPNCGTKSIPMSPKAALTIKINYQELKILTYWTERWATSSAFTEIQQRENSKLLRAIGNALRPQVCEQMKDPHASIFMTDELKELRTQIGDKDGDKVETNFPEI